MNYKEFFLTNNKSGWKTNERLLEKNEPELYSKIIEYSNKLNEISFKEKVWYFINNINSRIECSCGNYCKFRGSLKTGFNEFCSVECFNSSAENGKRVINANIEKYKAKSFTSTDKGKELIKKTKLERYGDESYNNMIQNKKTKMERYGNENYSNIEKAKETNYEKYGFDNPSKALIIKEKIKETNNIRFGFNSPTQSPIIQEKLKNTILDNIRKRFSEDEFINYDFNTNEFTLRCYNCQAEYTTPSGLYNERKRNNNETCLICAPIDSVSSFIETDLVNKLSEFYKGTILLNDRTTIKQELNIYLPENKLAIEFDGLYWHSELYKDINYHLNKTNKCNELGINLIHIFEDEWKYKKDIVISVLKNKLGLINQRIYARNCVIKLVDNSIADQFLNNNHLQGSGSKNSYRVGLYYLNELVSVMTFSRGRIAIGGKADDWELTRFCNKLNIVVIGAANKLFQQFIKDKNPNKIISYADKRWFNGQIYDKLGFIKTHDSKPNYWYVKNDLRYHRFSFRKNKLVEQGFDPNKTEKEIMLERKIYRIYDCGTQVFVYLG